MGPPVSDLLFNVAALSGKSVAIFAAYSFIDGYASSMVEYGVLLALISPPLVRLLPCQSYRALLIASLAVTVLEPWSLLLIPPPALGLQLFQEAGPALGLLQLFSTLLLGSLLKIQNDRTRLLRDLRARNVVFENAQEGVIITDLLLCARLEHTLQRAGREHAIVAVLFIDLDRFKRINDSLGHAVGDALLQSIAQRFQMAVGVQDTIARLGGDEFVVLAERLESWEDAALLAERLIATLATPIVLDGHELVLSASLGVSVYPRDGQSVETLLQNADAAMYRAKEQGRNNYQFAGALGSIQTHPSASRQR